MHRSSLDGRGRGFWTRSCLLAIVETLSLWLMLGCTVADSQGNGAVYSLASTRKLPGPEIKEYVSASIWQQIKDLEINHYVGMYAEVKDDGSLALARAFTAYPNHD